CARKEEFAHW
nr:immunoglobulin heavy chain junction region [Mus musculus]